jgi:hypothetical protein
MNMMYFTSFRFPWSLNEGTIRRNVSHFLTTKTFDIWVISLALLKILGLGGSFLALSFLGVFGGPCMCGEACTPGEGMS